MSVDLISDKALWDKFVDESPNSQLFHKWDFLKIVEKYTGYRLYNYGIYGGDELAGIIPIFYQRRKGLKFAYSPPQSTLAYIPYMGFVMSPGYKDMKQQEKERYLCYLLQETDHALRHLSPNYISLALAPGDIDIRPYEWSGYKASLQYTYEIDLDMPLEKLWEGLEKSCRNRINIASKFNPHMERSTDAERIFDMMKGRLSIEGSTFFHRQSPEYLKALMSTFPDNIKMYLVYGGEELIGGDVVYSYRDRCTSWMGTAVVNEKMQANEYMLWENIKKAKAEGYKKYENLGADEKRLNRFKTKFSPSLVPYFYVIKSDALYDMANYGSEQLVKLTSKKATADTMAEDDSKEE